MSERVGIVQRSGDAAARARAMETQGEVSLQRSTYRKCREKVDSLSNAWEMQRAMTESVRAKLDEAVEELSSAQEAIDADYLPEGAQPKARIAKRDHAQLQVGQLELALEAQRRSTAAAFDVLGEAEKKLFEADRDLHKMVDQLQDSELVNSMQAELDRDRSARLAKLEVQRAKRWESEQRQAVDARAAQIHELTALASKQLTAAATANKQATARVSATLAQQRQAVQKIDEARETHLADRLEAVLELKANQSNARAVAASQSEKKARKAEAARQQLEKEKASMLAKGLNPYTEFRKKEFAAEGRAREQRMKEAVEQNKAALAERLIKEEESNRTKEAAEIKAKEYEKKHRDEQGRHVVEERNQQYITSKTTGGREVLDPTGRASRVDPSQITDVPDLSFGLGKSQRIPAAAMARITEKIRQRLQVDRDDLGEYQHLIKGLLTGGDGGAEAGGKATEGAGAGKSADATSSSSSSSSKPAAAAAAALRDLASVTGRMPGIDKAAVTINLSGDEEQRADLLKIAQEEQGGELGSLRSSQDDAGPKYKTVALSKFEQDALERAKERQRDRLLQGTEQVAGGRTFHGQAFVPKPLEIVFKDFEVGQVLRQTFTLTNASYTFNSFRILDLDDAFVDFFLIKFDKPGRMSAGVSCPLHITFSPQVRADIFTSIRFLTETGPVEVPLKCLIKRCAPRITTTEIDFGRMIMGQKAVLPVKVTNSQAIGTDFYVARDEAPQQDDESALLQAAATANASSSRQVSPRPASAVPELEVELDMDERSTQPAANEAELAARVKRTTTEVLRRKQRENPLPLSLASAEGFVDGYNASSLDVVCAPLSVGPIEQTFTVSFAKVKDADASVDDLGEPVTREQRFTVRVVGDKVPIFLDDETMDLRTTLHGRIYRKRLELRNRAKTAYRVNVKVAPMFAAFVEVSPLMLFVQGRSSQFVNVKFAPTHDMLAKVGHFSVLREAFAHSALVCLPIELEVVNQDLPLYFVIRSEVTPSALELSTRRLDFGQVFVGQNSTMEVTLKNTSMLPQKVAFVRLKREISVQPNDGFAVLLPNESATFEVSFAPLSVAAVDLDLVLTSSFNDKYVLKVAAQAVEPPIELGTSVILMRTTGPGERVLESTTVRNTTQRPQSLEFVMPDPRFTWLKISPTIVDLAPGASARIELEFQPPAEAASLDPVAWHEALVETMRAQAADFASPLPEWRQESGWVFAKGLFGEIQWVKEGAGIPPPTSSSSSFSSSSAEARGADELKGDDEVGPESEVPPEAEDEQKRRREQEEEGGEGGQEDRPTDLPHDEWGVAARWQVPICIKQRDGGKNSKPANPLFLAVHTMVTLPQLEADPKVLDFGQMAIGMRELKTIKVINRSTEPVQLRLDGINAVGPFTLIRPPRLLGPGEMRTIVIECLPVQPGLAVEILELCSSDEVGGHQLRIPLRAQGLKPSIELTGLAPPPRTWNPRCGLLDFGSVVPSDRITKTFTVVNKSSFAVDVNIVRAAGKGLSPAQRAQLVERTAAGLPVLSYRPERVTVVQGGSQVITVTFDPDRGRFAPFREDLEVIVGQTDEILQVGVCGRAWPRQMYVVPGNPSDEPFSQVSAPGGTGVAPVEDLLRVHPSSEVRRVSAEAAARLHVDLPPLPPIRLEFPDPFDAAADPASYVEAGGAGGAAPAKGAKGGAAPAAAAGARSQQKKLLICCAKVNDNRPGNGNGTFDIVLSQQAKDSGLWQLSVDKGAVNAGAEVAVDVTCTLNKPRGIGGLCVGSWETFAAEVVLKGGWAPPGEPAETKIPLLLRCFISL